MDDLVGCGAAALSRLVAAGRAAPSEIMAAHLERIAAANPALNALVALRDPDALMAEARRADDAPRRGWLHGLPVAVKDLQDVAGLVTSRGSPIHAGEVAQRDGMLARRLRAAGAILIGKTNVPEFGLGSHSFNPVYGVTSNPYDGGVTAGGSSGGAAAALAARLVPVADGSDMMGSLRNPAAFCNVYGFRPSAGRVPSDPLGDAWLHMVATDGPMGRTVEDMARLLETLAVPDPANPHGMAWEPFAAGLGQAPAAPRIGWLGDWGGAYPMEAGILALCEEALAGMEAIGGRVTPLPPPFPAGRLWDSWTTLRSWAVGAGKAAYHADPARRALLKPEALWEIERGLALSAMAVHAASVARTEWLVRLSGLFEQYDVLALPSAQVWPFPKGWRHPETIAGRTMDSYHRWMEVVVPVSLAGLPCVSVPVGFGPSGLPMGLQLFGPRGVDRDVLRVAEAWHRATDWPGRRPPAAP